MRRLIFLLVLIISGCTVARPKFLFEEKKAPAAPDYSNSDHWAALPSKVDPADQCPSSEYIDVQDSSSVDVFFLHPTTFIGKKEALSWNADIHNQTLNEKTDGSSIKYQASIFNGVGRVFAPRYRQAHYGAYFTEDKASATKAFDLAYADITASFDYYLSHYNEGRPIIIAGHSQGTTHAIKLIKEYFDNKPLAEKLVVAYLVGMPVVRDAFENVKQCETQFDAGCFCSWRTFKKGHLPQKAFIGDHIAVNNPLSWTTTAGLAPEALNIGGMARKFEGGVIPGICDAEVKTGVLWASKPKFPGSIFLTRKNYHIADYNLFYSNIRQNARERVIAYLQSHPEHANK